MPRNHKLVVEEVQRVLKEKTKRYSFKKLEKEIIQTGACIECGACIAGCPVGVVAGNRRKGRYTPELVGDCISCGICYAMCPRTYVLNEDLIGDVRSAWKVRSLGNHQRQNGGAVTALLVYMLQTNYIEGAVIACQSDDRPWLPKAKLIKDSNKIEECSGTIYTHAQVIGKLLEGLEEGISNIAVVGTACNIEAINRMEIHPAGLLRLDPEAHVFKISLFCMESFNYDELRKFFIQAGVQIENIKKFDIANGELTITLPNEERRWPVAELDTASATSCSYCQDLTGLNADISCGNIGSEVDWTTVLVRSEAGEKILNGAIQAKFVEATPLEPKEIQSIINSSRYKMNNHYRLQHPQS